MGQNALWRYFNNQLAWLPERHLEYASSNSGASDLSPAIRVTEFVVFCLPFLKILAVLGILVAVTVYLFRARSVRRSLRVCMRVGGLAVAFADRNLWAVPGDELVDGVLVNAARGRRAEAIEHRQFAMIQIRQPKHSATKIRLDSAFAHHDGLPCRTIWDDGGRLDVATGWRFWGGSFERLFSAVMIVRWLATDPSFP